VPAAYAAFFAGHEGLLESHRGWDAGAFQLGRQIAKAFAAPFYASMTTRLLVDLNRSMGHRHLFSEVTRGLARLQRQEIVARHYRPHRDAVECEIARHCRWGTGDPYCLTQFHPTAQRCCPACRRGLAVRPQASPGIRAGATLAGGTRATRARAPVASQLSLSGSQRRPRIAVAQTPSGSCVHRVEFEVNQRFVQRGGAAWTMLRRHLVDSLAAALCIEPEHCSG
jgi:hypothetical protein